MDKVTKNIFVVLAVLVVVTAALTYHRTIVRKDYVVYPPEEIEEEISASGEEFSDNPLFAPNSTISDENEE